MIGEIFFQPVGICRHGIFPFLPVCRAYLAFMGADKLEGLQDPHSLSDRSTDGEAIDGRVHHYSIRINEKKAAQGNTLVLHQDGITSCGTFIQIR